MPNAEGRAATKRTPAKKTTPAAAGTPETKPERHVRTPLERAQSVYDKAKAASDKIATRLTAARDDVAKLEKEQQEAKVTLDWAASHPLLVKARTDAEDESVPAETDEVDADATPTDAAAEEGEPTGDLAGEPAAPADVFEQDEPGEGESVAPATAPFPFDRPPVVPAQPEAPFNFDAAAPTGNVTHI